ncbi:aminoglycoside phosphotransferase family protein [Brachybacterium paraconglomeratum]|uniref:aminoglycoside phosphotransferase family protein n=1 Tax=Brachybacterium paraconglomeratum TaxID=173362 RepID=UPI0021A66FBB|nr:aminoglycoside phosphotransferase family protein [Brachybacterium paraconglomeratum]MCT1908204.1 aminoglycoside phosphotransferase family protein [Brachybacterium paraconglomeratum]
MSSPAALVAGHPFPEGLRAAQDPALCAWLARLPALVDEVLERWELTALPPFRPGGSSTWVAPVRTADGGERVLKVAWAHEESRDEAAGMRAWQGLGAAQLLRSERRGDTAALLMEHVRPGVPLSRCLTWPERDEVAAAVLRRLRVPVDELLGADDDPAADSTLPAPSSFRPLADMCAWWADSAARRHAEAVPSLLPAGLVEHGLGLFRELPRDWDGEQILLVTDLNPGNILAHDGPERWLMIDPKPYIGDPHYDVLQHMLNDGERLVADPGAFADRMADLAELDRRRTRRWLLARCVQEAGEFDDAASAALRLAADGVE